ncbi:MAG: ABC transporter ATP-binding protein [Clostridia bacterium]|nr:ABC transporter ATP-binding protein [Clostridia bacterium]
MRHIFRYMRPYAPVVAWCLFFKIIGTLVELAIPFVLQHMLKVVAPQNDLKQIIYWGSLMILFAAAALVFNIVGNRLASRVARDGARSVRHDLFAKTMLLSCRDVDRFSIPSLESRLTTDTYNVHQFMGMTLRIGIRCPILLVGGLLFTFILDPVLTLILLSVMPLIFITVYFVTTRGVRAYLKAQRSVDGMVRVAREDCQGIRVIKALSRTEHENERYDRANRTLVRDEMRASLIMATSNPVITFFVNLGMVLVILFGAVRTSMDLSSPPTIIAFMQFFMMISNAMIAITRVFVNSTKAAASMNRIQEVIQADEDCPKAPEGAYPDFVSATGEMPHIRFENVSFSYLGAKPQVADLSFDLYHGETLGIIGSTGSGKTTVVNLLMRFYDPDKGAIYLDGKDLRNLDSETVHSRFGAAMQNDFLFADTVNENIKFGRDMTDEAVQSAATIAQADEFIRAFPEGYEHLLAIKGQNVSGGQKQRILVARALAGRPEILILDDSSSALDYQTEAQMRTAIRSMDNHPTTVIVAQRISAIKDANLILVMENGEVIGAGKHKDLLNTCSVYREIAESQMGDGEGGELHE